ncbi:hypothetical protein DL771_011405 [Monosporascus sp. 5C6A]|nr:hypothetical protein DL771_011405 [Monosporascus sp. 5C6A]
MVKVNKRAFKLSGFTFGEGQIFETHETTEKVYNAMIDQANKPASDLASLKQQVEDRMEKLFQIGVEQIEVYKASHGGDLFFTMIAEEFEGLAALDPSDIEQIFSVYMAARGRYRGTAAATKLVNLVDTFRSARAEVEATPHEHIFDLAYRPTSADRARMGLVESLAGLQISSSSSSTPSSPAVTWPPTYFNPQEKVWLCDSRIRWQLYGKGRQEPSDASDVPALPSRFAHPTDVKLYLAWLALTTFNPTSCNWSLYMTPIGFLDGKDRKDWFHATGGASKTYSTLPEFITYAKGLFNTRSVVAGFFTFWTAGDPESFEKLYASNGANKRRDLF